MRELFKLGNMYIEVKGAYIDVEVVETYETESTVARFTAKGTARTNTPEFFAFVKEVVNQLLEIPANKKIKELKELQKILNGWEILE